MRTRRIYFLNSFHIYHTAVLTVVIKLYVTSLVLIYLITGSLYLLITFMQFPLSPAPRDSFLERHCRLGNAVNALVNFPKTYIHRETGKVMHFRKHSLPPHPNVNFYLLM